MAIKIESPGLLSTIQDLGRFGHQKHGVVVSGAMDAMALRVGNILLGNEEGAPGIEVTLIGPDIRFEAGQLIALSGAHLSPQLNGQPVPMWRTVWVEAGSLLEFGRPVRGRFAYISVAGGIEISRVMESCSTYLKAGFGGFKGRALKKDDVIPCSGSSEQLLCFAESFRNRNRSFPAWGAVSPLYPSPEETAVVRVVIGPEYDRFTEKSKEEFWTSEFKVSPQSDRMGYQLEGPALSLLNKEEMISSAVTFGTVQVPPGGNPVILGADRQTTGGYPRIAQVLSVDLPKVVQVQPGKKLRFREVSMQEAHQLLYQQEKYVEQLKRAFQLKLFEKKK